jgi:hypothetical protein
MPRGNSRTARVKPRDRHADTSPSTASKGPRRGGPCLLWLKSRSPDCLHRPARAALPRPEPGLPGREASSEKPQASREGGGSWGNHGFPCGSIDLMTSLSHSSLTTRLDRLAPRDWDGFAYPPRVDRSTSGKRRFATVGDAVVQVLAEADAELGLGQIHARVELRLAESVSLSSVKNYLARGCKRRKPTLERVSRGRYRIARD